MFKPQKIVSLQKKLQEVVENDLQDQINMFEGKMNDPIPFNLMEASRFIQQGITSMGKAVERADKSVK